MSERTALITARRESEDNLIKTIIQLSSALIVLMAGFVSQAKVEISGLSSGLFAATIAGLVVAVISGLAEHYFASKAYLEQQKLVEDFYQKNISTFGEAPSNKWVRRSQVTAFTSFIAALLCVGIFALLKAGENNVEAERTSAPAAQVNADANASPAPNSDPISGAQTKPTISTPPRPPPSASSADGSGDRKGSAH